jgi:hypothetical protein
MLELLNHIGSGFCFGVGFWLVMIPVVILLRKSTPKNDDYNERSLAALLDRNAKYAALNETLREGFGDMTVTLDELRESVRPR